MVVELKRGMIRKSTVEQSIDDERNSVRQRQPSPKSGLRNIEPKLCNPVLSGIILYNFDLRIDTRLS